MVEYNASIASCKSKREKHNPSFPKEPTNHRVYKQATPLRHDSSLVLYIYIIIADESKILVDIY